MGADLKFQYSFLLQFDATPSSKPPIGQKLVKSLEDKQRVAALEAYGSSTSCDAIMKSNSWPDWKA